MLHYLVIGIPAGRESGIAWSTDIPEPYYHEKRLTETFPITSPSFLPFRKNKNMTERSKTERKTTIARQGGVQES
jgi:hypothetical protein